jgi:hypothetical protein
MLIKILRCKNYNQSQVCAILLLRRHRQENHKFKASLGRGSRETLSQIQNENEMA